MSILFFAVVIVVVVAVLEFSAEEDCNCEKEMKRYLFFSINLSVDIGSKEKMLPFTYLLIVTIDIKVQALCKQTDFKELLHC